MAVQAVQALPGAVLLAGIFFIPNSSRGLMSKSKVKEAPQALENLRSLPVSHLVVEREFGKIQVGIEQVTEANVGGIRALYREIMLPSVRKRMILVMVIQFGFRFSGGNITYYNTPILTSIY
jgi:MFS transporter, SP family, sugar:H+ symporter